MTICWGGVGGDFVFDVDCVEGAEEKVAGVGHDGAAARGEAVLGEEEQETGEKLVDFGGGLELGEIAEKFGGEGRIGEAMGWAGGVARAETGVSVGCRIAAGPAVLGAMAAERDAAFRLGCARGCGAGFGTEGGFR
jgi:hypothetical protein